MRIIVFLLLSFLLCRSGSAQTWFGLKGGIVMAHQTNAYGYAVNGTGQFNTYSSRNHTGLMGSWFIDAGLGGSFVIRQGFSYTVGGGKVPNEYDFNGNPISQALTYSLQYVQLPVQLLYSPSLSWGRPWIGLGPYGAILIGGTLQQGDASRPITIGPSSSLDNNDFGRFDVGISPTIGIDFKNGVLVGADYQIGLVDVGNNGAASGIKTKNRFLSIYAGYAWKFK